MFARLVGHHPRIMFELDCLLICYFIMLPPTVFMYNLFSLVGFKPFFPKNLTEPLIVWSPFDKCSFSSLCNMRLEVVGPRKKRALGKETRVSPSRAPVLSFAHYFQAPATQATVSVEPPIMTTSPQRPLFWSQRTVHTLTLV